VGFKLALAQQTNIGRDCGTRGRHGRLLKSGRFKNIVGTKSHAWRCEFAASTLGGSGGLLLDAAKKEDLGFPLALGL
jgi:hypothetical protein